VTVLLRNIDEGYRFLAGQTCKFLTGLVFIFHEDGASFSTLKIDVLACDAFSAYRAKAATCETEQWALNIITLQLHTLQTMKSWVGPKNEARV